jgi:outer membrane protein
MAVLRDRQIVRLRTDNLSILRGQVSSAAARQAAGDLSRTAVAQARTRAAEAEADLADARASLAESEAAWRATIGTGPIAPSLPGSLARMLPRSLEMALAQAETANPNVRSAALVARAAQFGVGVARGAMFPRVSVDGDYSTDLGRTLRSNETEAASVMVRLSIPLMDGGAGASRVRQARATSNQRSLEAADTRLMVRRAVAGAWAALDGARLRKAASGRRIAAAQAAVAGLNAEFASGMIAFSDLLDSRRELVNARIASVIADYDEVVAAFMLMAAAGTLSERMLDAAPERPVVATGSVGRPAPAAAVPARSAAAPQPARPVETASRPEPRRAASDPWAKIVPGQ